MLEIEVGCIVSHNDIPCDLIVVYTDDDYSQFIGVNTEKNIVAVITYCGKIVHQYDFTHYYNKLKQESNIKIVDKLSYIKDFDNE